jgi:[protein-PII] uridylyltransferase
MAQHPTTKGVRASTIRLIREHRHLIDAKFRNDVRARSLFMEILRQPHGITHELRRMNAYGVLGAYLPEFGQIIGRMQYDLFHTYTVDEHTLFLVRNLRRFYLRRFSHEFPHCSEVMQRIPKPELLYIAGLYHDIAKGRGGDHSELGAQDAQRFCSAHGLGQFDTRLVIWLVRNHLLMSMTAQKQDVNDPEVVHDFALVVGDLLYLDHIYLLTVADIRATNPKLWNSWRAALLQELYFGTRRALRRGLETVVDREQRIREIQDQARSRLTQRGIDERRIATAWSGFVADYFLRHTAEQVAWHTRAVLKKADDGRALVLARKDSKGTEIFVYQRERDALFATTTAILDQLGLTVVDARILTARTGYTLDSYTVLEADGQPIADRSRLRQIAGRLRRALNDLDATRPMSPRRTPRQLRYFNTPTTVSFDSEEPNGRTVVELITADRPGLLSRVGKVFTASGVRVHNARIATLGERAEDVFFVTDLHDRPFSEPDDQERIRNRLVRELDDGQPLEAA